MDDIFEEDGDDLLLGSKDFERRKELIKKNGLRDGLQEGEKKGLQKGFDDGYQKIFPIIEALGCIHGLANVVANSSLDCEEKCATNPTETKRLYNNLLESIKQFEERLIDEMEKNCWNERESLRKFESLRDDLLNLCESSNSQVDRDLILSCRLPTLSVDKK